MRTGEKQGEKYDFLTEDEFRAWIAADEFLEYALVHDRWYYWTKRDRVIKTWEQNKIAIKELEILGREKVRHDSFFGPKCRTIFLDIDDTTMTIRMLQRQPDMAMEELESRLKSAEYERNQARNLCHYLIDARQSLEDVKKQVDHAIHTFMADPTRG